MRYIVTLMLDVNEDHGSPGEWDWFRLLDLSPGEDVGCPKVVLVPEEGEG